jgi:RNA polymerase-binding protein DksA
MDAMPVSYDMQREQLETERERLVTELKQLDVAGSKNVGYGTHMADDASAAFDQARDLALRSNLEEKLKQVQSALNSFDNGTYGVCEVCGQRIDPARLKALPHASKCLDCQRHLEK